MLTLDLRLLNFRKEDKEMYDNYCFLFYKEFLYSKEKYDIFISDFNGMLNKYKNDPDKYIKVIFDLADYFSERCIEEYRTENVPVITALIKNIVEVYKFDNKVFEKSCIGGKRNFLYYLDLFVMLKNANANDQKPILDEIYKTGIEMNEFRNTVLHGPSAQ